MTVLNNFDPLGLSVSVTNVSAEGTNNNKNNNETLKTRLETFSDEDDESGGATVLKAATASSGVSAAALVPSIDPDALLTVEQFKMALPDKVKKSVNQQLIDQINATLGDPNMYENYRDNLLSYTRVMADGKFKIDNYVSAVKYVSHKLMGATNLEAYMKTFPEKYQRFLMQGIESKDIASYVTAYNKSKLVNLIFEQTLIPSYVLNQDLYQKALNVQADLMMNAKSEKVRTDAANSLLTQLKMPEVKKVELDIGVKEDSSINRLREATLELARQQRLMMESGAMTAQEVAHSKVITDVEFTENNDS